MSDTVSYCSNADSAGPGPVTRHAPVLTLPRRYNPVSVYATVPEAGAEQVDFRLTRVRSEEGVGATQDPTEAEFERFIKELSSENGLEQLLQSTAPHSSFRYRRYKELSEFLRGLTYNFPKITHLKRYASPLTVTL